MRKPTTPTSIVQGLLEMHPKGYGFLRARNRQLRRTSEDAFVSKAIIQRFSLRQGCLITGKCRQASGRAVSPRLVDVHEVDGHSLATYAAPTPFSELTATNPTRWLRLEHAQQPVAMRVIDLLCPIARGQRALVASPPRAGKTTLLKQIAQSVVRNYPDMCVKMLLVDERPEEVTDMQAERSCEVFASTLDQDARSHVRISRMVMEHCQRLAESGKDVLLLIDSLTRMARAFNKLPGYRGPVGAGGLNIQALDEPKKFFGAARPFVEGGSLTIVASVLIETQNRMDDVIFREFKGTGNLDIVLDQAIADRRIWPAINLAESATRRVELFQDPATLQAATLVRNRLLNLSPVEAMDVLISRLGRFPTNADLVALVNGTLSPKS